MTEFQRLAHLAWLTADQSAQRLAESAEAAIEDAVATATEPLQEALDEAQAQVRQLSDALGVDQIVKDLRDQAAYDRKALSTELALIVRELADAIGGPRCSTKAGRQALASYLQKSVIYRIQATTSQDEASAVRQTLQRALNAPT